MAVSRKAQRPTSGHIKRALILDAARKVFENEGLEGASLRAIAGAAGYTPAALYFHFDSKEAIYAEVLRESLTRLGAAVREAVTPYKTPVARLKAAAMGFFTYYADNPRDLDLGFYLFRGGMKPAGVGKERDQILNAALAEALHPIAAAAEDLGASPDEARAVMAGAFAHAAGALLLAQTGRARMFAISATDLMERYVDTILATLPGTRRAKGR